jgi:hypothetical protein
MADRSVNQIRYAALITKVSFREASSTKLVTSKVQQWAPSRHSRLMRRHPTPTIYPRPFADVQLINLLAM